MDSLLAEISNASPVGVDIRLSNPDLYQEIKSVRHHAKSIERKNPQQISFSSTSSWEVVFDLSVEALLHHTKDLEVVAWLIEALLRLNYFSGLATGFLLAKELIEKYTFLLHPIAEEEDISFAASFLSYLNGIDSEGALIAPLALIPLTCTEGHGSFALWQYEQALIFQKNNTDVEMHPSLEDIRLSALHTNKSFFDDLHTDIQSCLAAFQSLCGVLNVVYSGNAPPSSQIDHQLHACLRCVNSLSQREMSTSQRVDVCAKAFPQEYENPINSQSQEINSRLAAIQAIAMAAAYFKKSEPHSPLSYLLEKVLRWGRMEFPALLQELVQDETMLQQIYRLSGVSPLT